MSLEELLVLGMPLWAFVLIVIALLTSIIWFFKFKPEEER